MWRSKARAFLLRSSLRSRHYPVQSQVPSKTLTPAPSPTPIPSRAWDRPPQFPNPRFFSSVSEEVGTDGNGGLDENPGPISQESDAGGSDAGFGKTGSWNFEENDASPLKFEDGDEDGDGFAGFPKLGLEESGVSSLGFREDNGKNETEESLTSLWEGSVNGDDQKDIFTSAESVEVAEEDKVLEIDTEQLGISEESIQVAEENEAPEIDIEQVEKVLSILRSTPQEPIELSLDKLELTLSEEFVLRVFQSSNVFGENLVKFFRWTLRNDESVRTPRVIELLVFSVSISTELSKKEAYMLWDLVKQIGEEKGLLNSDMLNQLISIFWKLGKAKAALEVFNKFEEFGCCADGNTYYYTIEALGKRSMFDTAWSVCEKMLSSGNLPDGEKIGKIITFFCKGKKAKEAHLVYLVAKENKICPPKSSLDFLIGGLARNDETVRLALELLEDYSGESLKYRNKNFASVVRGLCRIQDIQEAKRLVLRMVDMGPAPGNAVFNYVITALSKGGDMEDAVALIKVMEGRGLRPDIYTYSVVMSGYAKGGLMDEAYKIFREAKMRHPKLSPITYHILIRGYCKLEEFEKALECLKEMKEDGVQPTTDEYNKLIQSLCLKALDWRTAENLLEEMKGSGLHLKGVTRSLIAAVKELEEEEVQSEVSVAA